MRKTLSNFTAGEITPRLEGRLELNKYQHGAKTIENAIVWPHGGTSKRAGTVFAAEIADSTAVPRLQGFVYSVDETYALCFENNLIRIFADGGLVTDTAENITAITQANPAVVTITGHSLSDGDKIRIVSVGGMVELNNREFTVANSTANTFELSGVDSSAYTAYTSGGTASKIIEVVTTYTTAQLNDLRFTQSADILYIAHPSHPLRKLGRTSNTVWTLTDIAPTDGPFRDINGDDTQKFYIAIDATTVNVSDATQADPCVITTSSAHGFESGECVTFSSVGGMTELNGNRYFIVKLSDTTFSLRHESYRDIDSTGYTAYTSGGTVNRSITKWGTYSEGSTGHSLTTDFSYFDSDMVGQLMRLNEPGEATGISQPIKDTGISSSSVISNDGKVYGLDNLSGTTVWEGDWNLPTHESGTVRTEDASGSEKVDLVYLHDVNAIVEITEVTNSTTAKCRVVRNHVPADVITYGTSAWEEGAWSDYHGYPRVVTFHEGRLWAFGTTRDTQKFWFSQSNAYESFLDGDLDDRAGDAQYASNTVDIPRWAISSGNVLALGTSGSEYTIVSNESGKGITPGNIRVKKQTGRGSSNTEGVLAGDSVVYAARFGKTSNSSRKLREFDYTFEKDKHTSPHLTIISEHISGSGITELSYSQEPNSIIWGPRDDGEIVGCTYEREQDVVGFHRTDIAGTSSEVESVTVIPGDYGDEVWLVVKRTVNGATVRYVEYQSRELQIDDDIDDFIAFDSSATYDGAATTTISGLNHLIGETVGVIGDGVKQNDATVASDGTITISSASKVHVGLKPTMTVTTLPIEANPQQGDTQGRIKRMTRLWLRVYRSAGGKLQVNNGNIVDLTYRAGDGDQTSPAATPSLFSGLIEIVPPSGWDRELEISVIHDDPYPFNLLGIIAEMS